MEIKRSGSQNSSKGSAEYFTGTVRINPLFEATVQATEESIINALLAADTMTGADDLRVTALPHDRLREILRKYNRLNR